MSIKPFSDEHFMKEALKEAQKAFDQDEVPVGAVIVFKNQIIARAHNQVETLNDATAHAEMIAMTSAMSSVGSKYLSDCIMYVTLEPCPMCASASNHAQIKNIVYGASDEKRGFQTLNPSILHPKANVKSGVLVEECTSILQQFFKEKRGSI